MGYCLVNSTISVSLKNGSSITTKPASFAGDQVTIYGDYLSPSSYIDINGFTGTIASYTPTAVTYNVPIISAAALISTIPTTRPVNSNLRPEDDVNADWKKIDPSQLTTFSDQNGTSSSSSAVLDGNENTVYISPNTICWIGLDLGANLALNLSRIRYFPSMSWDNVVSELYQAVFESSNDMINWTELGIANSDAHTGWNSIEVQSNIAYRYIRMRHNSTSQCSLAEM